MVGMYPSRCAQWDPASVDFHRPPPSLAAYQMRPSGAEMAFSTRPPVDVAQSVAMSGLMSSTLKPLGLVAEVLSLGAPDEHEDELLLPELVPPELVPPELAPPELVPPELVLLEVVSPQHPAVKIISPSMEGITSALNHVLALIR